MATLIKKGDLVLKFGELEPCIVNSVSGDAVTLKNFFDPYGVISGFASKEDLVLFTPHGAKQNLDRLFGWAV